MAAVWGQFWQSNQVLVHLDNMSVVDIIPANTSKDKTIMNLLRVLHFICAFYNINLRDTHIQGVRNLSANAIFCDSLQVFLIHRESHRQRDSNSNPGSTVGDTGPVATRLPVAELETR